VSVAAVAALEAARVPAEVRGAARSDVSLLVATRSDARVRRAPFQAIGRFLAAGDLLVVNTSATLPAALPAALDGEELVVHLSTPLRRGRWAVEIRGADRARRERPPLRARLRLPAGASLVVRGAHRGSERLVEAQLCLPESLRTYLARWGSPIRYGDAGPGWPLEAHQTIFARDPGSAEMPSAGRPFTAELVSDLMCAGVLLAPITLHAGVSSLERDEAPPPERVHVPAHTAWLANAVHARGGRVVAVGTTVVRALEGATDERGETAPHAGWTNVLIGPSRGLRCVDGLLTGWHEPEASHQLMLEAVAGADLLRRCYATAAALGFLGHEFGDAHLILP